MTSLPAWCADFIGIPYVEGARDLASGGLDCWGFVRHVLARRFGVEVDELSGLRWDRHGVKSLAQGAIRAASEPQWIEAWEPDYPGEPVAWVNLNPGDVLLFRLDGNPCHVGVVAQAPLFLHSERAHDSAVGELSSLAWARRVFGVYRHERLGEGRPRRGSLQP